MNCGICGKKIKGGRWFCDRCGIPESRPKSLPNGITLFQAFLRISFLLVLFFSFAVYKLGQDFIEEKEKVLSSKKIKAELDFENLPSEIQKNSFVKSPTTRRYKIEVTTEGLPLRVRKSPLITSQIIHRLKNGSKVPLTRDFLNNNSGEWLKVEYSKNKFGWVSSSFVRRIEIPAQLNILEDKEILDSHLNALKPVHLLVGVGMANVRREPYGEIIMVLRKGEEVEVINSDIGWLEIKAHDKSGWIREYLVKTIFK